MVKKIIKLKVDSEYLIYNLQEIFDSAVELLMPESELTKKFRESFLKSFKGENGLINPVKPKIVKKSCGNCKNQFEESNFDCKDCKDTPNLYLWEPTDEVIKKQWKEN
jgi:hypothetical protein